MHAYNNIWCTRPCASVHMYHGTSAILDFYNDIKRIDWYIIIDMIYAIGQYITLMFDIVPACSTTIDNRVIKRDWKLLRREANLHVINRRRVVVTPTRLLNVVR